MPNVCGTVSPLNRTMVPMPVIEMPKPPSGIEYVSVQRDGAKIVAMVGPNLQDGIGGFGDSIPEALRDLADAIERERWRSTIVF